MGLHSESPPVTAAVKDRRPDALGDLRVLPDDILSAVLVYLTPRDVARLSCVSSVMYILCNEEPLWMSLCLNIVNQQLQYKGSWKKTALHQMGLHDEYERLCGTPLHFDGFNSLFLYRRLYRCYTTLEGFSFDSGNVERAKFLSLEEFQNKYDKKKPVLIAGLADSWPAKNKWTIEQLLSNYGDTIFRISQRSPRKIKMKFKDYVSYMQVQHDEDPLYIFDDKFGEVAPHLLEDYSVPDLFQEDFFDVLDKEKRPPFRWLIIGPQRSGASWHVDPALTSAWNTLLCGRKRWALYPPGRVPLGVTVHVNEEDGDVNIDGPSSLQWWLDFYPLLANEDKPIECTQLPGETIFVPSGWWHCVLNLEPTVAVTQNFVNCKNFEFACLDMAPGYRHKGVCRAGLLALDEDDIEEVKIKKLCATNNLSYTSLSRKEKRIRTCRLTEDSNHESSRNEGSKYDYMGHLEFSYDIYFLSMFLEDERDHYNSLWSSSNCIGQRELREWLWKLWVGKPGLRDLIWKGACIALNARKWLEFASEICSFHELPLPTNDELLPVGTGSNPVYIVADDVIKIFVEGGLEACLYSLGTELEFYNILNEVDSPLKSHIPGVTFSGILFLKNGSCTLIPWDGKGVPDLLGSCNLVPEEHKGDYPFGVWSKQQFEYRKAGMSFDESAVNSGRYSATLPYIVIERCRGKIFADLRDFLTWEDTLDLASFLGEQLRNLHLLPCPLLDNLKPVENDNKNEVPISNNFLQDDVHNTRIPEEWDLFIKTLNRKRKDVRSRLTKWGDPIPDELIQKVDEYLPKDIGEFLFMFEDEAEVCKSCTWIHSDIMDDNIYMEPCYINSSSQENSSDPDLMNVNLVNGSQTRKPRKWSASHILDFSDLSLGDPVYDLIPIHLDVFRGDTRLLKQLLESYKLPLVRGKALKEPTTRNRCGRLSYQALCYCILHDDNVLGAVFSMWEELRKAKSWEEVEETVWGDLNSYTGFS